MDNTKKPQLQNPQQATINTRAGARGRDPLHYNHPYDSMRRYAGLLALRHDSPRTRHSYTGAHQLLKKCAGASRAKGPEIQQPGASEERALPQVQ